MLTTAAVATTKFPSDPNELLVTGFPGLRARRLVRAALDAQPGLCLTALVHPRRLPSAEQAISALGAADRIRLLAGDPTAIDFGLGRFDYLELAGSIRSVHHVYQVLDLAAPREAAEAVNVGGAREIIELSRAARALERVVHHSSVFVSGDRTGLVMEHDLHANQSFGSPVAASLALAEAMLRRHPEVPLTVVRSGQVVGDSVTGVVDRLDGVYPLLVFLQSAPSDVALPMPPAQTLETPLYLVPVDYVARAAFFLGGLAETRGQTLHLLDPQPLSTRRFLELSAEHFGKRLSPGFNAGALGRSLFKNPATGLLGQKLRALGELVMRDVSYDDAVARRHLEGSGSVCPPLESYLGVLLAHVEERVRARQVAGSPVEEAVDAVG
jgi:thioester reductase-like protein